MKRWWLIALGLVITFLVLSVWQKCTAWEDRYTFDPESRGPRQALVDGDRLVYVNSPLAHNQFVTFRRSENERRIGGLYSTRLEHFWLVRDFTYLPPYFRWWYGGK